MDVETALSQRQAATTLAYRYPASHIGFIDDCIGMSLVRKEGTKVRQNFTDSFSVSSGQHRCHLVAAMRIGQGKSLFVLSSLRDIASKSHRLTQCRPRSSRPLHHQSLADTLQ